MTDSYHFESVPKFRVGGVYRQQNGVIVKLESRPDTGTAQAVRCAPDLPGAFKNSGGARRLIDGRYVFQAAVAEYDSHLIPGELVQRDGQWVAADAPIVFPSGAAVLTSGDKIVGRVEAEPESLTDLIERVFGQQTPTQHYAVDPNARMKVRDAGLYPSRAPLPHFNQRTEFDAFPDYVVFHEFEPVAPLHTSPTTDSAYPAIAGLLRG